MHGYYYQTEHYFDFLGGINFLCFIAVAGILISVTEADAKKEKKAFPEEQGLFEDPRKLVMTIEYFLTRFWLMAFLWWRAGERKGDGRFDQWKPYFWKYLVVSAMLF